MDNEPKRTWEVDLKLFGYDVYKQAKYAKRTFIGTQEEFDQYLQERREDHTFEKVIGYTEITNTDEQPGRV